jgi:hypothetical protein
MSTTDTVLGERGHRIEAACELLGNMSRSQLYAEIRAGRITARKAGSRTVILQSEIDRYLTSLPTIDAEASS